MESEDGDGKGQVGEEPQQEPLRAWGDDLGQPSDRWSIASSQDPPRAWGDELGRPVGTLGVRTAGVRCRGRGSHLAVALENATSTAI